jgi:dTDP-glucose 4,6-dehydratase
MVQTILITGGAGFLGCNLVKYLLSTSDVRIVVVDNFITSNCANIRNVIKDSEERVDIREYDICTPMFVDYFTSTYEEINEIYHLASLASPVAYQKYPLQTLDVGYLGTKNVLELCKYYTGCKALYTSTSEVYGDALEHPQKESYYGNVNTVGERSSYDESKRIGETLVYTYRKLYGIDTRIVRIFNTYGPYMNIDDGRIVTEIVKSLLYGTTLRIFGDGKQTRSLCYVDDTIRMMVQVMQGTYNSPINIGSDQETTINDLVKQCVRVYLDIYPQLPSLRVMNVERDCDDPKIRRPCLDTYTSILGTQSFTSLYQGLRRTMLYFVADVGC